MLGKNGRSRVLEDERDGSLPDKLGRPPVSTGTAPAPPGRDETPPQVDQIQSRVLVILLPIYHNAGKDGSRRPVENDAFEQTFAEIKEFSSGYRLYKGEGWCHSVRFRGDFDEHIRIEIEALFSDEDIAFLKTWKHRLEIRFRQDSIYMSLDGPVLWL